MMGYPIFVSLKHRSNRYLGRAYWKSKSGVLFPANILRYVAPSWKKDVELRRFIWEFWKSYFHEYLHLFFKFELGQYQNSCKTKIDPLSQRLAYIMMEDDNLLPMEEAFSDLPLQSSVTTRKSED